MNKRIIVQAASAVGILVLILDSKTAVSAASQGITLCLQAVIPSLFPFFLFSNLALGASDSNSWLLSALGRVFHLPDGTQSLLIPAFLCGYPVGAQYAGRMYQEGKISRDSAERLLAFCSNSGPAFLFGLLAGAFSRKSDLFILWGGQILGAMLAAACFPADREKVQTMQGNALGPAQAMVLALKAMAMVCGWVILFRVLIGFLDRWFLWLLPLWARVALCGILELTNGCLLLPLISGEVFRLLLCSILLSLGGLCVLMQTLSVTGGLSLRFYLAGKMIQTVAACLFCICCRCGLWYFLPLMLLSLLPWRRMHEKNSGFSSRISV